MAPSLCSAAVKTRSRELGFDLCGIAPADDFPELGFFREWLARGFAGGMEYLERSADRRADVRRILPSARTVVVTGTVYNTRRPYSTECADPHRALIARYAWGDDYHEIIARRLDALLDWMRATSSEPFEARAYVDTGPVQERVYAQYAGIGWIGKNSCVINPELGSWLFLSVIVCSLPLEADEPALDQCGTCTLCLEACPTEAIVAPGTVDSTRCISYLTIELRGKHPEPLEAAIGSHVFGCDICQDVCPWNAAPAVSADPAWQIRPVWDGAAVSTLAAMDDEELRRVTRHSPVRRAKIDGLRRNLATAQRNIDAATIQRFGR
jgi:epoxyqueuosine reductase